VTKEDVNDVYKLIMEQRARIEALETALRVIWLQNMEPYAREIARVALTDHQSAPAGSSSLPSGESGPAVMSDLAGAGTPATINRIEALEAALRRCQTVLGNMAQKNEGTIFNRWPINHEPLRSDARNLLPIIDAALAPEQR
jgi:hypothetical protein